MKTGEFWYCAMFRFCGEGTCGDWGSAPTFEAAMEEIQSYIDAGDYDCWITDPDGNTVYEKELT